LAARERHHRRSGSDVIIGGAGDDTLDSTNSGNASLSGGWNDLLLGGNGKDSLVGDETATTLRGGTERLSRWRAATTTRRKAATTE
jgi:Ca2+-binding RTX toxin-like protein